MAGSSASTSSWGGSGSRGCFFLGEDMFRESGAEDRAEEVADGDSRGSESGRSSSDEGGDESGEEFALMVSTLSTSRGFVGRVDGRRVWEARQERALFAMEK
jgi:hypothetical protein